MLYIQLETKQTSPIDTLRKKLDEEIVGFRKGYDNLPPGHAYDDWYIISFYESYYEMLMSSYIAEESSHEEEITWLSRMEKPLGYLYSVWLDCDPAPNYDWDVMIEWICLIHKELN